MTLPDGDGFINYFIIIFKGVLALYPFTFAVIIILLPLLIIMQLSSLRKYKLSLLQIKIFDYVAVYLICDWYKLLYTSGRIS